jgi:hypothetical protein
VAVLSFAQAQEAARKWRSNLIAPDKPTVDPETYSVADALRDYMAGFEGKSRAATQSRADLITAELGGERVARLTAERVRKWLRQRADAPARLRTGKGADKLNVRGR